MRATIALAPIDLRSGNDDGEGHIVNMNLGEAMDLAQEHYQGHYREEHKDELAEKGRQYYEEHKDELAEKRRQYYEEHKDELAEKRRQYIYCCSVCGVLGHNARTCTGGSE